MKTTNKILNKIKIHISFHKNIKITETEIFKAKESINHTQKTDLILQLII